MDYTIPVIFNNKDDNVNDNDKSNNKSEKKISTPNISQISLNKIFKFE